MKKNIRNILVLVLCSCGLLLLTSAYSFHKTGDDQTTELKPTTYASSGLWLDLVTPNIAESSKFYGEVFGWTVKTYNFNGNNHAHIYSNGSLIGGMIEAKDAQSSAWVGSYSVSKDDLAALKKGIVSSGLNPILQLLNIPNRGKQVFFESPQGEEFALVLDDNIIQNANNAESKKTWLGLELWSSDVEKSKAFYEKAFNVDVTQKMVNSKPYWVFTSNGKTIAGMIKNPVKNQGNQWVPYIRESDLNLRVSAIEAANGNVLLKPTMDVRSGNVSLAQDPYGAIFAIQKTN